jgi:RimJ/RimL family protein N-acetyltransferase
MSTRDVGRSIRRRLGHPTTGSGRTGPSISERPPEIVVEGPVELRRHTTAGRAALVDAINRSLGELRPWMPWAQVPATDESIGVFLDHSRRAWDEGVEFGYSIASAEAPERADGPERSERSERSDDVIGACGLHFRSDPGVAEIGYWVRTDRTGAGVATAAACALTRVALDLSEVERIEIHCDAENAASRAVAARAGFRLDRIELRPSTPRTPAETDQLMVWVHPG